MELLSMFADKKSNSRKNPVTVTPWKRRVNDTGVYPGEVAELDLIQCSKLIIE